MFALLRLASLALSTAVFGVSATLIYGLQDPAQIVIAWGTGFLLWLPSTILQLRIRFFPSPPDPWLDDADGGHSEVDVRRLGRSELADMVLGMLPPLALVTWFVRQVGMSWPFQLLLLALPALFVVRILVALRRQLVREVLLALSAGRATEAKARLEPLSGGGRRWLGDLGAYLLARARFLAGDPDGALDAIASIRDREGFAAELLEAQIDIERIGPERVLALAERIDQSNAPSRMLVAPLRALANLHLGRDEQVIADTDALLALPWNEARRFSALLLAAAWAPTDERRARAVLAEIPWPPERVRAMAACWAPVSARLAPLLDQVR